MLFERVNPHVVSVQCTYEHKDDAVGCWEGCRGCAGGAWLTGPVPGYFAQRPVGMDQRAPPPLPRGASFEYRYMTEFQSHEPEFDYLKSLEIEEKINKVRWCRSSNNTRMLLSTNDKTVKLWKVGSKYWLRCGMCHGRDMPLQALGVLSRRCMRRRCRP